MKENLFEEEKSLFRKKINSAMEDNSNKVIKDIIKLVLLKNSMKNKNYLKLVELYSYFGLDEFVDLIDIMNGSTVSFPTIEEFKDTVKLAISYYYKFLKNKSWDEIKEIINDDEGGTNVKYGINCSRLNRFITELSEYQKFLDAHNEEIQNEGKQQQQ